MAAFRAENGGAWPQKIAFSLWSSEAIRHLGVTEAQILHALGLRPIWDAADAARYRIFSNEPGNYGTGVPHLALASTEWEDAAVLAEQLRGT